MRGANRYVELLAAQRGPSNWPCSDRLVHVCAPRITVYQIAVDLGVEFRQDAAIQHALDDDRAGVMERVGDGIG